MYQKVIRLFLYDGNPNERIICDLSNWNGIAYKIPRQMVKISVKPKLEFIENTGVYFLIGEKDEIPYIYIGEAENLYVRLCQELSERDFWTECIVFTRTDNTLNKAHVKYMEHVLYNLVKKSARYEVDNGNTPTKSTLSMTDEAEIKEVIDNIMMLTNALGYKVFIDASKKKIVNDNLLTFKTKSFNATGLETNDGFMVLKGSTISKEQANSLHDGHKALRKRLIDEKIIDENYCFVENYIFNSSSNAGCIVSGYRVSGPRSWKDKNGKSIIELNKESFKNENK